MSFPNLVVTTAGKVAMLRVIEGQEDGSGETLQFTRIGLGCGGEAPADIEALTDLQNPVCNGILTGYKRINGDGVEDENGEYAVLSWQLQTNSVSADFDWTEYGLWAANSDGEEILFSYSYDEHPMPICVADTDILILADINICIGTAENVNAVIGEYSAYASKDDLQNHINDYNNPHKATAVQIGAAEAEHTHSTDDIDGGILPIARGGTGNTTGLAASATKLATARTIRTNLASTSTASFDGTANITPGVTGVLPTAYGGTGNTTGLAASATKLATARTIRTNLASTSTASFDGTANITPGVTGVLPTAYGGTGSSGMAYAPIIWASSSDGGYSVLIYFNSTSSSPFIVTMPSHGILYVTPPLTECTTTNTAITTHYYDVSTVSSSATFASKVKVYIWDRGSSYSTGRYRVQIKSSYTTVTWASVMLLRPAENQLYGVAIS